MAESATCQFWDKKKRAGTFLLFANQERFICPEALSVQTWGGSLALGFRTVRPAHGSKHNSRRALLLLLL